MSNIDSGSENPMPMQPKENIVPGMVYAPPVESAPTQDPYETLRASVDNPSGTIVNDIFQKQGVEIDWSTLSKDLTWRGKLHLLEEGARLLPHLEAWKKNGIPQEVITKNVNSILGLTKGLVNNNPLYTGK